MKLSLSAAFNYRYLTGAFLVPALFLGGKAQAQIDIYVSETAQSNNATTLVEYAVNPTAGTATLLNTYTPTGVFGGTTAEESGLQYSENGDSLSYAGFTTGSSTTAKSTEVLFTPSTGTFDTSTGSSNATVRNSYYGTTTGGTNGFFGATGSVALGFVSQGGTTSASVVSNTSSVGTSALDVTYNSGTQNLYYTRNTTLGGVYTPSTNGSGLVSSAVPFTELTGSGWVTTGTTPNVYTGLAFLGASNLFVADTSTNTLDLFTAANPDATNDWDLKFSLALSTTESIEQVSVDPTGANSAIVFFTTNGTGTGTFSPAGDASTLEEVSYNSSTGFGTPNILESSTTEYFTGVAAVPEPGTYAMFGLGLGIMGLMAARKKAGRKISPM